MLACHKTMLQFAPVSGIPSTGKYEPLYNIGQCILLDSVYYWLEVVANPIAASQFVEIKRNYDDCCAFEQYINLNTQYCKMSWLEFMYLNNFPLLSYQIKDIKQLMIKLLTYYCDSFSNFV